MVQWRHLFYITRCFLSSRHNSRWSLAHKYLHSSSGLCTTPEQETYSRLFKALSLNPSSVTIDFEMAVRNALKQTATNFQISFYYFHFCQSLLRHVQNQGKTPYGEAEDLYGKYVRMAAALAFLPAKDVIERFELFKYCNGDSDVSDFLEYFEKTYRGVPQQIGSDRCAPRFAVSEWSVYQAVMERKSKTKINVEVWKTFQQRCECKTFPLENCSKPVTRNQSPFKFVVLVRCKSHRIFSSEVRKYHFQVWYVW